MSISVQEAEKQIISLKETEISLGASPEILHGYENHVYGVAKVAKAIASFIPTLNSDEVYVSALLHDICRPSEEREQRFHGILGFEKLIDKDEKAARIALLHMFPWFEIPSYETCAKFFFYKQEDYAFVRGFAQSTQATDFDLLIQLADGLANKDGFVTLEERQMEYFERRGYEMPKRVVTAVQKLKEYFDKKIGKDVYELFLQRERNGHMR